MGDDLPLIGVGGVQTPRQAYEKILAGASLVHGVQMRNRAPHSRGIQARSTTVPVAIDQRTFAHGLAHLNQSRDVGDRKSTLDQ